MNSQDSFKIQFQLTKKGSEIKQASLIIQSFDLLSWLNQECKIDVISQNKIQVLIDQKYNKKIILTQQLQLLEKKDYLLELIKNQKSIPIHSGFQQYNKKALNEEILIREIFKQIDEKKLRNKKFSFREHIQTTQTLSLNQFTKQQLLKYRRFKINKQIQQKKPQFYLIQKSKRCFCKKYQQKDIQLRAFIEYILIDFNSAQSDQIYLFQVQISMNSWVSQDIKRNIQRQHMNKQKIESILRKVLKQKKNQIKTRMQSESNESLFQKMKQQMNQYMNLLMKAQLNRNVYEYLDGNTYQKIQYQKRNFKRTPNQQKKDKKQSLIKQNINFFYKNQYNQVSEQSEINSEKSKVQTNEKKLENNQSQIKGEVKIAYINLDELEQTKRSEMTEIQNNLFINQFTNQQLRRFIKTYMNQLLKEMANNLVNKQKKQYIIENDNSLQIKIQKIIQLVKFMLIQMMKNTVLEWVKKIMDYKIKKQIHSLVNQQIKGQIQTYQKEKNSQLGSNHQVIKNKIKKLIKVFNNQKVKNIINQKQLKKSTIQWIKNYIMKLIQQQKDQFIKSYLKNNYLRNCLNEWIINNITSNNDFSIDQPKILKIQVFNFTPFAERYCTFYQSPAQIKSQQQGLKKGPITFNINQSMRNCLTEQNKNLKNNQFQYPFIEAKSNKSKDVTPKNVNTKNGNQYYTLAFQGGGAKGIAYVGVYKALLQTKLPIKSIIGSSAGGISALAVSTNISPTELQKLCYPMGQIAKHDRFIIQKSQKRDQQQKIIWDAIKFLLHQHGIISQDIFDYLKQLLKPSLIQKLRIFLQSLDDNIGFLFGPTQYGDKLNYYGLLLKGAFMKGQAMENVGAECLTKYMLKEFSEKGGIHMKRAFSIRKWRIIQNALVKHNLNYENFRNLSLGTIVNQNNLLMDNQTKKTFIITLVNKCLLYLSQLTQNSQMGQTALIDDQLSNLNFEQLLSIFKLTLINKNKENLSQEIIYEVLTNNYRRIRQQGYNFDQNDIMTMKKFHKYHCKQMYDNYFSQMKFSSSTYQRKIKVQYICVQRANRLLKQVLQIPQITVLRPKLIRNIHTLLERLDIWFIRFLNSSQSQFDYFINLQSKQIFKRLLQQSLQQIDSLLQQVKNQQLKSDIKTLKNYQSFFSKPFLLNPDLFSFKPNVQLQNINIYRFLLSLSSQFNDNHWKSIADIVTETIMYFYKQKNQQIFKSSFSQKKQQQSYWQKTKKLLFCSSSRNIPQVQISNSFKPLQINIEIIANKIRDYQYLNQIMKIITFQEYYILNGIQLTLTSVDLNMKTLRFFNHKTSPGLPVCKSVRMTGAFPVAFKSVEWKPQWGNYFVHFDDVRRQIDLTNHEFTDGGMLANFPIKYLDNDIMRPKYFSHLNTQKGRFFGFGLDDLTSENYYRSAQKQKETYEKKHKFEIALKQLIDEFKSQLISFKSIWKYYKSPNKTTVTINKQFPMKVIQNINKIPLISFLIKFMDAYPNADRNLNVECFSQNIIIEQKQELDNQYIQPNQDIYNKKIVQRIQSIKTQKQYQQTIFNIQESIKYFENQWKNNNYHSYQNIDTQPILQNISLDRQVFIIHQCLQLQDNIDSSAQINNILQYQQQFNRKISSYRFNLKTQSILQSSQNSQEQLNSSLKFKILQAMMQKMKKQYTQQRICQLTTSQMLRNQIFLHKINPIQTKQIKNKLLKDKILQLAKYKFQRLFDKKKFNQIEMLGCFQNYKEYYYQQIYGIQEEQQWAKQKAFKQLSQLNRKQLQQFIDIQKFLITKNLKNFTTFIYAQIIDYQNKQIWFDEVSEMGLNELLSKRGKKLSVQKLLQMWNIYFNKKNQSLFLSEQKSIFLSEQNIIKNYFEWQLAQKLFIQIKSDPDKFLQIFRRILSKNRKKLDKKDDIQLLAILNKLSQDKCQVKKQRDIQGYKIIEQQQQNAIKFIIGCYKTNIFGGFKQNFISKILKNINNKQYNEYLVEKNLHVVNRLQIIRVSILIKQSINLWQIIYLNQQMILSNLRQIFVQNTSLFYYQIKKQQFATYKNDEKTQIIRIVNQYYDNCVMNIYQYYRNRHNHQVELIQNLKQEIVIQTVINIEQDKLRQKIKQQNLEQLLQEDIRKEQSIFRNNVSLVRYNCINNSFQRFIYQINTFIIQQRLEQQSRQKFKLFSNISSCQSQEKQKNKLSNQYKQTQKKIQKYYKCKYDFQFVKKIVNQLCITLSRQLNSDPFQKFNHITKEWKQQLRNILQHSAQIIQSQNTKNKFFQFKRAIIQYFRRHFILIWKFSSIDTEIRQGINRLGKQIFNQLNQKFGLFKKEFHIRKLVQNLYCIIQNMEEYFNILCQSFQGQIQILNIQKNVIQKYLRSFYYQLYQMNCQINERLTKTNINRQEQIFVQDIEQWFLIKNSLFQDLSNLQESASKLKLNHWFLNKLNLHKFSISLFSIDKKLIQKNKSINIKNQIITIIDRQVQNLQELDLYKNTNYELHLVIEGFGKSHLYYSSYMKLIEESLAAYRVSKNISNQVRTMQNFQKLQCNNSQKCPILIPKVNVQLSAITCSNFHSVFGFLYTCGLQNEDLRRQMNRLQSIASVLSRNIQQNFDDYKWTACSEMQIKMFFNQVWKDQFNTFNELQQIYNKEVDIIKHVQSAKQIYLADKQKIITYCQNSFDFLIDFINKKINKQTFQKRKLEISKGLGIKYTCDNQKLHYFEDQNASSSKYVQQLMKSMFNHYQSLIQYVLTSNQLILKNFSVTQGNKQSLWKGIVIKKLYSTYKLKSYICARLKQCKMNPNITLAQFYQQANKKILLSFTTIDNSNSKLQFMNKNTFPNMPVWATILAATSLHYLYKQFQARTQWTSKKFSTTSLFSKVVNDFFQKKNSNNNVIKYSCGNFISTLPLQLLTNGIVCKQMFLLKQNNSNKQYSKFIYIALAFEPLLRKPDSYKISLQKNYLQGALLKFISYKSRSLTFNNSISCAISPCLEVLCNLISCKNKCFDANKMFNFQKGHRNNSYKLQNSTYITQKISKILNYCLTGKVFDLLVLSNDNLIMSLYREKVIKCPIKMGTLDFNLIVQKNKKVTKLDISSSETLQTIDRSYQITRNFIVDKIVAGQRQVFVRIELFNQNYIKNRSKPIHNNIKCKLSFLSHSQWIKNIYQQFIIEYSLFEGHFQNNPFFRVENSQIVWDTELNNSIILKFYYPYQQMINNKKKIYIIESKIYLSIQPILKNFMCNMKLSNAPNCVSFDYIINYTQVKKQRYAIMAKNMNRIPIVSEEIKNRSQIYFSRQLNNQYVKHKKLQFRYQFTNFIMNRTYTDQRAQLINNYPQLNKIVVLVCVHCSKDLTLLAKSSKSHYKCMICDSLYGKLQCRNGLGDIGTFQKNCSNSSYCLSCLNEYILRRKKDRVICLLCTTKNQIYRQSIRLDESQFKIRLPRRGQPHQDECFFCYEPYSVTMLYQCSKCKIKICTKCIGKHC